MGARVREGKRYYTVACPVYSQSCPKKENQGTQLKGHTGDTLWWAEGRGTAAKAAATTSSSTTESATA